MSIERWERMEAAPSLLSFQRLCKAWLLGPYEIMRLLRLRPPGVTFREFQRFFKACEREGTTPAHALAQFIKVYGGEE